MARLLAVLALAQFAGVSSGALVPQARLSPKGMVGGARAREGTDAEVIAAAQQVVWTYARRAAAGGGASAPLPALSSVAEATSQVVSGVLFKLRLSVVDTVCAATSAEAAAPDSLAACAPLPGATPRAVPAAFSAWHQPWAKAPAPAWRICWTPDVEPAGAEPVPATCVCWQADGTSEAACPA